MNIKLSHLIILIAGVIITISLSFLPKYVVNDKEKKLRETEAKVKKEVQEQNAQHASADVSSEDLNRLKTHLKTSENVEQQVVLVDSLTKMYRDAFLLDSAMYVYLEYAHISDAFYVQAIRDGLTGLRMSPSQDKKKFYEDLCLSTIEKGLTANPENKELIVEQLRLGVYGSKARETGPMQSILAIKSLVNEEPNLVSARMAYAEFLVMRAQMDPSFISKAIEQYTKITEIDVDNLQSRLELVTLHLNSGNESKAKEYLLQLQKINKDIQDPFIEDFVNKNLNNIN